MIRRKGGKVYKEKDGHITRKHILMVDMGALTGDGKINHEQLRRKLCVHIKNGCGCFV